VQARGGPAGGAAAPRARPGRAGLAVPAQREWGRDGRPGGRMRARGRGAGGGLVGVQGARWGGGLVGLGSWVAAARGQGWREIRAAG